jgi:hypothetical protein
LRFHTKLFAVFAAAALWLGESHDSKALTLQAGDSVSYNFDFTGQTPAPPYLGIFAVFSLGNFAPAPDRATFEFFGGLDGTGGLVKSIPSFLVGDQTSMFSGDPEIVDGIFSLRLTVETGAFDVESVTADAYNHQVGGNPDASVAATAVPEPGSLALFGAMLTIAALRRRK